MRENSFELKKSLLLFSGGLDSTTLFYMLNNTDIPFECILINYGQPGVREINYAKKLCKKHNVHYEIFSLDKKLFFENKNKKNKSLGGLPNRNAVFISMAVSYALQHNIQNIYYGAIGNTNQSFCDCQPEFLRKFNELLSVSDLTKIKLIAPFIYKNKEYVLSKALELGVPLSECWSCDNGGINNKPCGECSSCEDRLNTETRLKKKYLNKIHNLNTSIISHYHNKKNKS